MSSKDFLVVNPGLTYFYLSQRVTPQQLAVAKKEGMFTHTANFQVAPYTQKLQPTLKAQYKKEQLEDKKHKERFGDNADYVLRDGTPRPGYEVLYEYNAEEISRQLLTH